MTSRLLLALVSVCLVGALQTGCVGLVAEHDASASVPNAADAVGSSGDAAIAEAFDAGRSDVAVTGSGTVARVLADDNEGGRHQRFILELSSGQTLLIAHNIDVAPRIEPLAVGDIVEFHGVYEYNEQGGVVHWTHRDLQGSHEAGWLRHAGAVYQ